jgi:POT family proton-dependent oligopeptide transporter
LPPSGATVGGHPRGLYTLFFTEMWERFSYYGMRALLVLFMVDLIQEGGMGLSDEVATAIYGLYTAGVYLAALPGGWLGDRLFGARKSIWYGGLVIAAGHFTLAIPREEAFYLGLILVVLGTGLLKPNISAIVGQLYPEGGARRDAGFTIFYMGINLGAFLGPLVCGALGEGALGERANWHMGFGAAGVGMVLGLIVFRLTERNLGEAGSRSKETRPLNGVERAALFAGAAALMVLIALTLSGSVVINPVALARGATGFIVAIAVLYFAAVFLLVKLNGAERRRVGVIAILFVASALFWAGFEQAGSTFNLFAERYTDRVIDLLEWEIPTTWFQSLGPIFIIVLAPVLASGWIALARRGLEPSMPVKFALALFLLCLGFLVMSLASSFVAAGQKVWPTWLITTYFLHTVGELCLSPVGLSSVTKLSPRRLTGQMMGIWFLATALGNLIAGLVAGEFKADAVERMPLMYLQVTILPAMAAFSLIILAGPIRRWMGGVK